MTTPITIPNFLLKQGLEYTQCLDSPRCPGGSAYGKVVKDSNVELIIDLDSFNVPFQASAYLPNKATCSRGVAESTACELNLIFTGDQLDQLKNSSSILQQKLSALQKPSGDKAESQNGWFKEQQNAYGTGGNEVNPYYAIGLIIAIIPIISAIMIGRLRKHNAALKSILNSMLRSEPKTSSTIAPMHASSVSKQISNSGMTPSDSRNGCTAEESQLNTDQKLEEVLSRLDLLEQQMVSLLMKSSLKRDELDRSG